MKLSNYMVKQNGLLAVKKVESYKKNIYTKSLLKHKRFIDQNGIRKFFSKNWMTHNAMWYVTCVQELGPEVTNRLNKTVVGLIAGLEIKQLTKLMRRSTNNPLTDFVNWPRSLKPHLAWSRQNL